MTKSTSEVADHFAAEIRKADLLLSQAARALGKSNYNKQKELLLKSLKIAEQLFTRIEENSDTLENVSKQSCEQLLLKILQSLGHFYFESDKFASAKEYLERALDLCQQTLGTDDFSYLELLGLMAIACHELKEFADAEKICTQFIALSERLCGEVNIAGFEMVTLLADCYRAQGKELMASITETRADEIEAKLDLSEFRSYLRSL